MSEYINQNSFIGIIDYGMGNLHSVLNAFRAFGRKAELISNPDDLKSSVGIVLPGVGAFGDGMKNLREGGFIPIMEELVLEKKRPFLGICLGMQLLATRGFEHGENDGLNWIPGVVDKISFPEQIKTLRVPHMGWNEVVFSHKSELFSGLGEAQAFYFVHSFTFRPERSEVIGGTCHYGVDLVANVEWENIYATQFHPEKSHSAGLALLKNWCAIVDRQS